MMKTIPKKSTMPLALVEHVGQFGKKKEVLFPMNTVLYQWCQSNGKKHGIVSSEFIADQ